MLTFTTFIQHTTETSSESNQARKRNKIQIRSKEVKLTPFIDVTCYKTPMSSQKTVRNNK